MKYLVTLLTMLSCSTFATGVDFDNNPTLKIQPTEINIPMVAKQYNRVEKEWTIMVYVNAKNNLEQFGVKDVNEMEMVGSNTNMNVVAELGRISGYDASDGDWRGSRRYYITRDNNSSKITSKVLQSVEKSNMGDWSRLAEFITWAKINFPAKHYMVVIWNHGSGWNKGRHPVITRGISYDDETGDHISTPELAKVFKKAGNVDIVDFDACLMQMAEVGYELKDYVDIMIGSEETEPGDGNTYNTFLGGIKSKASAEDVSRQLIKSYIDHYGSIGEGSTLSAINLKKMVSIGIVLDRWTDYVSLEVSKSLIKDAISESQTFYYRDNRDLMHFVYLVREKANNPKVTELSNAVIRELRSAIFANGFISSSYKDANGLAIYVPISGIGAGYEALAWSKNTKWYSFLKWVVNKDAE